MPLALEGLAHLPAAILVATFTTVLPMQMAVATVQVGAVAVRHAHRTIHAFQTAGGIGISTLRIVETGGASSGAVTNAVGIGIVRKTMSRR